MLQTLSIKNYAIIDALEIQFAEGMNTITGETGAGKSILLGALSLLLGERADTKVLYNKDEKCVVEATFFIRNRQLKQLFKEEELDFEIQTIIRREISAAGKSRAFINDSPVNLNVLKRITEQLVNIHNQHETLELTEAGFQLEILDALATVADVLNPYREQFGQYKRDSKRLDDLMAAQKKASAESDYLQFQLQELEAANLIEEEQEQLEQEQKTLSNVEDIKQVLKATQLLLDEGEVSVLNSIGGALAQLRAVKNLNKDMADLNARIESVHQELKDISREVESIQDQTIVDPERLQEVNDRLHTIYRLCKKHQVNSTKELLAIQAGLQEKLLSYNNNHETIEKLHKQLDADLKALVKTAEQLHSKRTAVKDSFEKEAVQLLAKTGMPNAAFKAEIKRLPNEEINTNGLSDVRFLFSANKGFTPEEINKVASGGELSRLMLCIKSLVADAVDLPTLIFDEIDAGISGEVALRVGEVMKKLSKKHQLISITHLPQIAKAGSTHFYIYKETKGEKTYTRIRQLNEEERVREIAKMLSGDKVSKAALENARELIGN